MNYYNPYYTPPLQDNLQALRNNQYQQYNQPMAMPNKAQDERIWVQGEVGAKAYLVAPMNTVTLWDTETQSIYVKSVNASGVPSMQKLTYTLDVPEPVVNNNYITREEFEKALKELRGDKDEQ